MMTALGVCHMLPVLQQPSDAHGFQFLFRLIITCKQ